MKKIAIIGAGLAGLTIANTLKDLVDITIFEKSRGVSGRMSTRYADPYYFDHGAQYFTAKSDEFKAFLQPMIDNSIVREWQASFAEISNREIINNRTWGSNYNHYVGSPRMNAIAQYLAKDLNVQLNTEVSSVTKSNKLWSIYDRDKNSLGVYDWVVFAVPSDQLKELLPQDIYFYEHISSIKMNSCFSLMLGYSKDIDLGFDSALVHDEIISWISLNSSKPERPTASCILVHSSNHWADKHIDDNREKILEIIFDRTKNILDTNLDDPDYKTLHAWRYANIQKQNTQGFFIEEKQTIAACGDWCIKGRVESAFTSGFRLANQIKTII